MASVNIGSSNAGDEFYRYKMPALQSKIEGRGNGIKTNVMNMVEVAKALGRPASYTTKYFGTELGAQTKFEETSGLAIVNGAHETHRLSQLLEGFIKRFVQCGQCNNPETDIVLTKRETIELHCKACGAVTQVDMRHKLCTFILKNPPVIKDKSKKLRRAEKERIKEGEAIDKAEKEKKKSSKDKGDKKEKKSKKEKDKGKEKEESEEEGGGGGSGGSGAGGDDGSDEDDVQWSTDTSAAAAAARAVEQLTDGAADLVTAVKNVSLDDAGNGATAAAGSSDDDGDGDGDDEDEDEDALVKQLRAYAAKHSAAETAAFLRGLACDGPEHRAHVAVTALLDAGASAAPLKAQATARAGALKGAAADAAGRGALLAALEAWLAEAPPAIAKGTALALKELYDADVLDEASLVTWYDNAAAARKFGVAPDGAKAVRKAAHAFVDWLRNAESDEDEDDDDDE